MLLRELGILSARYAEEEGLVNQRTLPLSSSAPQLSTSVAIPVPVTLNLPPKSSTIVSAPIPPVAVQNTPVKALSPALSSVSSASLPDSPILANSPLCSSSDLQVPAVVPLLAQRPSFPAASKIQQLGLSFMPMAPGFNQAISTPQGILLQTPVGLTQLSAVPTTVLTTPHYVAAPHADPASSVSSARMRKPFHKRRPAHMDKSMLFCHFCGRKETPEWRKGPAGPATLCNACGLQWAKKVRAQRNSSGSRSSTNSVQDVPESVAVTSETASSTTKDAAKQEENATTA